jgi:misacylated tRNA(Ala) deacylase
VPAYNALINGDERVTQELFREDAYCKQCEAEVVAVEENGIRLDRTVFYPTGGGQPGDTGVLQRQDGVRVTIVDTRKADQGGILHIPAEGSALLRIGDRVTAEIDWGRRYRHMRMHTCLHLLCGLVDAGVTGGSIGADKGRLDFDLQQPILNKQDLTEALNRLIGEDRAVGARWITDAELDAQPELVKTLSVQPPRGQGRVRLMEVEGVDLQPCGGTHVTRTGEIGAVKVSKIEKKSRHNRRVIVTFADDS